MQVYDSLALEDSSEVVEAVVVRCIISRSEHPTIPQLAMDLRAKLSAA